ncbi:hypothetical protein CEP52_015817 [Fusarium oligoseptatum]|uniref:VWFA domain-containing protein n=1 Tax=Fusarium oligoseptatum TaxID=2604345 RepID=A0A428S9B6_9HYPO|nr:hypothetical protein CEP52_015817 [Fusarium oligoseptatum]
MSSHPPTRVIGCLLDVSGSMRQTLETGQGDNRAVERLQAVLSAALKFARAEQQRETSTLVFVGLFGLDASTGCPPVVDLCGAVDALVCDNDDVNRSGHDLLIALANENNLAHITKYFRTKLTDQEALVLHAYLRRHPERKGELIAAIPDERLIKGCQTAATNIGGTAGRVLGSLLGEAGARVGSTAGAYFASSVVEVAEDYAVRNSEALRLARQMCDEWLNDFVILVPRPVSQVVHLLQRLQGHRSEARNGNEDKDILLDLLRRHLYGRTPMREALSSSLEAFQEYPLTAQGGSVQQRVLLVISDGAWTDDNPIPTAAELRNQEVTITTVFLTSNEKIPRRRLVDKARVSWCRGQRALFDMASMISCATHPVPVLASVGWEVPSSGECALYTTVCSISALEEFCSLLSSARFGSADMLLDIVGRMNLDAYIDGQHAQTRRRPSNQAVVHMALLRIVGREGGCPSMEEIRGWILHQDNFPDNLPGNEGWDVREILEVIPSRYRPLRFQRVDEDGARQAVLRRRPVLATFHLSKDGWVAFAKHFKNDETRTKVLTYGEMAPYRSLEPDEDGHAVVMTGCDPFSLTFLNSWGRDWGNNGSFSIENSSVLELDGPEKLRMDFYDVYWLEGELTDNEREAYNARVDEELRSRSSNHPSIFDLDSRCPLCLAIAPIREFSGSIRRVTCPRCGKSFSPEPGHLVQALYAQAGLSDGDGGA